MKRKFILFSSAFFAVCLLFVNLSVALSGSYVDPVTTESPHGGYTTSTNKCKYCHAVHLASGQYMLTRADTVFESCDYCHGDGAGAGTIIVTNFEGHTVGKNYLFLGDAPGHVDGDKFSSTPGNPFSCVTCHSVHGEPEHTVVLADQNKNYLLRKNPDSKDNELGPQNTLSEWCADCHPLMFGSNETPKKVGGVDLFSHASSATVVTTAVIDASDGKNYGPNCRQCHASSLFPHGQGGTGRDMLKDSFDGISIDSVCIDCHVEEELP